MFIFFVVWCQCCCFWRHALKYFVWMYTCWMMRKHWVFLVLWARMHFVCFFLWFNARRDRFTYNCGFILSQKIPHFVVQDGCFRRCCCCYCCICFDVEYLLMHKSHEHFTCNLFGGVVMKIKMMWIATMIYL